MAAERAETKSHSCDNLDTVDLKNSSHSLQNSPTLEFQQKVGSPIPPSASATLESFPIEGQELQSRSRTKSGATLKEWTTHQIKVSKQLISERFGHGVRTVDTQLETRIEQLKETQKKYAHLIDMASQFARNFSVVLETQKTLAEHFAFMSIRAPELYLEFKCNSSIQKSVAKSGELLLASVNAFTSGMHTISSKTMEDTLQTVKEYDIARLAYDAYRSDLESLKKQTKSADRLPTVAADFEKRKLKFEQLRNDVDIKLKLLDENKVLCITHAMHASAVLFIVYSL